MLDNFCNLFKDCLYLFSLPFSFRNRLRGLRLRNCLSGICNWYLFNSHICDLLSFFIKVIDSLLGLWLFWSLGNDCENFSEKSLFGNNSLYIFSLHFFSNLLEYNCVLRLDRFHNGWTSCSNSFSAFFCHCSLNCSWTDHFGNWLFVCTNNFLLLISDDSNFFVFISNFRNGSISYLLHYNSDRSHILNLSIFSFNFLHDFLKMSILFNHSLVYNLSNHYLFNNLICSYFFSFFSLFSVNCIGADNFNFGLILFISNCNNNSTLVWIISFMNNYCRLYFILWCFCHCWWNLTCLWEWFIFSHFGYNILYDLGLFHHFNIICSDYLSSCDFINFYLCSWVFGSDGLRFDSHIRFVTYHCVKLICWISNRYSLSLDIFRVGDSHNICVNFWILFNFNAVDFKVLWKILLFNNFFPKGGELGLLQLLLRNFRNNWLNLSHWNFFYVRFCWLSFKINQCNLFCCFIKRRFDFDNLSSFFC